MNFTNRLIDCDAHGQQVVVLVADGRGQFQDQCVKCRRDDIAADRRCACECGAALGAHQANTKYVGQRHRQRAHREDLRERAIALGVNTSLSVKTLASASTTTNRRGDGENGARAAQRARSKPRKPELRISYRKAVDALANWFFDEGLFWDEAVARATEILVPQLTDRQRAAL